MSAMAFSHHRIYTVEPLAKVRQKAIRFVGVQK
jgi:hypothetical protein